jgi:hypothetical protein
VRGLAPRTPLLSPKLQCYGCPPGSVCSVCLGGVPPEGARRGMPRQYRDTSIRYEISYRSWIINPYRDKIGFSATLDRAGRCILARSLSACWSVTTSGGGAMVVRRPQNWIADDGWLRANVKSIDCHAYPIGWSRRCWVDGYLVRQQGDICGLLKRRHGDWSNCVRRQEA